MIISQSKSLKGVLGIPGDKSISHRAVMLGSIADGKTEITGFLNGDDCLSTISCFQKMGIEIEQRGDTVIVNGKGLYGLKAHQGVLDTGNSGTTTRLISGILAAQRFDSIVDGDSSIRKRPMNRVIVPLREMGASIESSAGGTCPLQISGRDLHGIDYSMPVASAQLKSALLLAGLYAEGATTLTEPSTSRNHSELMLRQFGANVKSEKNRIRITGKTPLTAQRVEVPGDISSAAYFLAAALIVPHSEITVKNVGINPTRTGLIDVIKAMGGNIKIEHIRGTSELVADITASSSALKGTVIGGDLIPRLIDELPVIAVMAAFAEGKTIIRDAEELKVKESNRIAVMANELKKAHIGVEETEDGMVINPGNDLRPAEFDSHGDHRVAMSCAVLSLMCPGNSILRGEDSVNISFPGFFDILSRLSI